MTSSHNSMKIALAWCLTWGNERKPPFDLAVLHQIREALKNGQEVPEVPEKAQALVKQVEELQNIPEDFFPNPLEELKNRYPQLWEQTTRIGLVYGGATKIKQYVFESANLQDIRGASALLDRINLVDLPALFDNNKKMPWLVDNFPELAHALIPELIIYSTGGNILAFCPAAFVHDLANAIERRYTEETLTANSCAVGDTFKLLEIRFGLLKDPMENTHWLDWYHTQYHKPIVQAYFGKIKAEAKKAEIDEAFKTRKSFNELVGKLAGQFNIRRSGNDFPEINRPTRRYPPMFETHPYLVRDESDHRSAISRTKLAGEPWFSDALARKRIVGQRAKREGFRGQNWYKNRDFHWQTGELNRPWNSGRLKSWILQFDEYLSRCHDTHEYYKDVQNKQEVKEAQTIAEIGNHSQGFVAFIYADGNNMGGYIQKQIKTPQRYKEFSEDVDKATRLSVYKSLATHLKPHRLKDLTGTDMEDRNGVLIHPFEILAIGGDDVMLIVPANKALEIAKTIGEEFEEQLRHTGRYTFHLNNENAHRFHGEKPSDDVCELSMSMGVLITSDATPIYYAKNLYEQLLKSAKKRAKELKKDYNYFGGTVDFLVMKSVTMLSSSVEAFRQEGLIKSGKPTLKLYAAPYTLHELGGLVKTAEKLKESGFPRSQLYQIRSLLEKGKHTAILNYRYFLARLGEAEQRLLKTYFEDAWCKANTNDGNLAPWMFLEASAYETIWRELVEIYAFIDEPAQKIEYSSTQEEVKQ